MKKSIHVAAALAAGLTGFAAFPSAAHADEARSQAGCSGGEATSFVSTDITFPNGQPAQDLSGIMAGLAGSCLFQFGNGGGFTLGVNARALGGQLEDAQTDGNEIRQFVSSDSLIAFTAEVGYEFDNDAYVYFEAG